MSQISTKESITEVYLKYQWTLFSVAMTYSTSWAVCYDIIVDALIAVLEKDLCFPNEAACMAYFKRTIHNKASNYVKLKNNVEPAADETFEHALIERNILEHPFSTVEVQLLLQELLAEYPHEVRTAFVLHVLDDISIPTLAKMYGVKNDTLRKQFQRIKAKIAATIPYKDMTAFLFALLSLSVPRG